MEHFVREEKARALESDGVGRPFDADKTDDLLAAARQTLGRPVGDVTELLDDLENSGTGSGTYSIMAMQDARDCRRRDARQASAVI
jgi:hypothetical protein